MPEPTESPPLARRIGLFLGPTAFVTMLLLPAPEGMSATAWHTAAVAAFMAIWWVTEAIPIAATGFLPMVLFPLLGVATITRASAPFANPVIYLFLGGFIIAVALQRCGLHRRMALTIVKLVGTNPNRMVGGFMVATAFISMWVSNAATVVMMLPLALAVLDRVDKAGQTAADKNFAVALLLGIAYASSIGGLGTLIGTPPNALVAGFMSETYGVQIGFLQWMVLGIPMVLVALPLTWLLLTRVFYPIRMKTLPGGGEMIATELAALGRPSREEVIVGTVTLLTAIAWIMSPLLVRVLPSISDTGIAITAALLLFLVPVERNGGWQPLAWEHAEKLPWGVLVLFGGGLSLADQVQETGLATWIGGSLGGLGGVPDFAAVVIVVTLIVFITELASNTATTATFLPVVGALALGIGMEPIMLAVPTALAASCGFMMPAGTPPNAIVYASGHLTIWQMVRAGFWLNLMMIVVIALAMYLLAGPALGIGR